MLLDGILELRFHQHLPDTLLDDRSLLQVKCTHTENLHTIHFCQVRMLARSPFARCDDNHLVTFIAEFPHQVRIDAAILDTMHIGHRKEYYVHIVDICILEIKLYSEGMLIHENVTVRVKVIVILLHFLILLGYRYLSIPITTSGLNPTLMTVDRPRPKSFIDVPSSHTSSSTIR